MQLQNIHQPLRSRFAKMRPEHSPMHAPGEQQIGYQGQKTEEGKIIQLFRRGYGTSLSENPARNYHREEQTSDQDAIAKENEIIQQLRELSMVNVEKRRAIAKSEAGELAYSRGNSQIFEILPPPMPKQDALDYLREQQRKDQDQKVKEDQIIQQLRELSMVDVEKARVLAQRAIEEFPYSPRMSRILEILAPPKVTTQPASGLPREQEFEWLRKNSGKYRGQWVALYKNKCLAAGPQLIEVRNKAQEQTDLKNVLITYIPN